MIEAGSKFLKVGAERLKSVGLKGGSYAQAAAKGALTMGAIGGASEWSQGGSFWGGAKSNAVSGAALGMGVRAGNIAINGEGWSSATISSTYNKARGVSKPLQSIRRNETGQQMAQQVMALGGRGSGQLALGAGAIPMGGSGSPINMAGGGKQFF